MPPIASGDVGRLPGRDERQADRAAAVHEEAVERVRQRLHAVVVGDERERRLRLTRGDQPLRLQAAQAARRCGARAATCVKMSNEKPSPGCCERAVARRIDRLEALARGVGAGRRLDLHEHRSALDADPLRRDADPRVAGAHDLLLQARPVGIGVDAAADVEPLDDHVAAELRRVRRRRARAPGCGTRALASGTNFQRPSWVSAPSTLYDVAVPAAAYSCCT